MFKSNSLFSQILQMFPKSEFFGHVKALNCEKFAKGFTCWQQLVAMLFCQLGSANSLREITDGLASCEGKLRHLGIKAPRRSSLSYANKHRPWELYRNLFFDILQKCQTLAAKHKRKFKFKNKLYTIDSTTLDLCLSVFDWAKFRRTKGAVKIHLQLDNNGCLPKYAYISNGNVHDKKALPHFTLEKGAFYTFDKAYNDYSFYDTLTEKGCTFVTRIKENAKYDILESRSACPEKNIIADEVILFSGFYSEEKCSHELRLVTYWDDENSRSFAFLTNNMKLSAHTIARIYKARWDIEIFFKDLKQNLKIKTFIGTSYNAVQIQIWTALIGILLLKYLKLKSKFSWSLSNLAAILRFNLFTYRDLWRWIDKPFEILPENLNSEQLRLEF